MPEFLHEFHRPSAIFAAALQAGVAKHAVQTDLIFDHLFSVFFVSSEVNPSKDFRIFEKFFQWNSRRSNDKRAGLGVFIFESG
jgi:hypothetical protein